MCCAVAYVATIGAETYKFCMSETDFGDNVSERDGSYSENGGKRYYDLECDREFGLDAAT